MEVDAQAVKQDINDIRITVAIGLSSFTILFFDHIITFSDEVNYIWKRSKGPLVYLFLFNRYIMPLGFIVNLVAYTLQLWPDHTCDRYVKYEGIMTAIGIEVVALIMLIRVYALYQNKFRPTIVLAFILLVETGVNIWLVATQGKAVPHVSTDQSCTMIFDEGLNRVAATAWVWIPLLYDTVVLFFVLYRTVPSIRNKEAGQIIRTVFHDGLLYYCSIVAVTLPPIIMISEPGILAGRDGVINVAAQFQLLITVTLMSRLTLHLKEQGQLSASHQGDDPIHEITFSRGRSFSDATTRMRGRSFSHSNYLLGGADISVNIARPAPLHLLPTISSSWSSTVEEWVSHDNGSRASTSTDMNAITCHKTQSLDRLEIVVAQTQTPTKKDEETV